MMAPWMLAASSLGRKTAVAPIWGWVVYERDGRVAISGSRKSRWAWVMSVRVGPGAIAFTRIPAGPYSAARARVRPWTADFVLLYSAALAIPLVPLIEPMLMITPPPRSVMPGTSAAVSRIGALTLTARAASIMASVVAVVAV